MKRKRTFDFPIFLIVAFFCLVISYCFASDDANSDTQEFSLPSKIRLSVETSTKDRNSFYVDYLFPLYYSKAQDMLLFFNPKQTLHSPSSEELNLGLCLRKIFKDSFILGLHFFYDKKYSTSRIWHYQRGYGLEYLSEPLDVRFNYYDPTSKAKIADFGYKFGQSNLLCWKSYEEPLEGFDFEFGFPVIPKKLNTRLYLGGYFYDSKLSKDVEGIRIRTETNLNKWLSIDTSLERRNSGEIDFTGGIRITIPFELTKIPKKEGPFKTPPEKPYIKERLFERVVRDIDIQSSSSIQQETATVTTSSGATIDNIIFVDNSNTGSEDGSLAHPYNTLAEAFDSPEYTEGATIYVFKGDGTANGYTGNYTLSNNVILWGSGYHGGLKYLPTQGYPVIDGEDNLYTITLAENNTIMGCQIQNGASAGIYAGASPRALEVSHNILKYDSAPGSFLVSILTNSENSSLVISDNIFNGLSLDNNIIGVIFSCSGATKSHSVEINRNTFLNCDNALYVLSSAQDTSLTVADNTFSGSEYNIYITSSMNNVFNAAIYRNTITGGDPGHSGIRISFGGTSSGTVHIFDNTVTNLNWASGIYLGITDESSPDISIYRNVVHDTNSVTVTGDSTGDFIVDLGGGSLGSPGYNSIYHNTDQDLSNAFDEPIFAQNNWWGTDEPETDQFDGNITYSPWLTSDPN